MPRFVQQTFTVILTSKSGGNDEQQTKPDRRLAFRNFHDGSPLADHVLETQPSGQSSSPAEKGTAPVEHES